MWQEVSAVFVILVGECFQLSHFFHRSTVDQYAKPPSENMVSIQRNCSDLCRSACRPTRSTSHQPNNLGIRDSDQQLGCLDGSVESFGTKLRLKYASLAG